jgi:hypothetical protein
VLNRGDRREPIFQTYQNRDLFIARRLRQETTMTLNWIAEKLNMGVAGSLANLLRNKKGKR